jgi:hypothetical protein
MHRRRSERSLNLIDAWEAPSAGSNRAPAITPINMFTFEIDLI